MEYQITPEKAKELLDTMKEAETKEVEYGIDKINFHGGDLLTYDAFLYQRQINLKDTLLMKFGKNSIKEINPSVFVMTLIVNPLTEESEKIWKKLYVRAYHNKILSDSYHLGTNLYLQEAEFKKLQDTLLPINESYIQLVLEQDKHRILVNVDEVDDFIQNVLGGYSSRPRNAVKYDTKVVALEGNIDDELDLEYDHVKRYEQENHFVIGVIFACILAVVCFIIFTN